MAYKIEKGIKAPIRSSEKFPIAGMQKEDSFVIPWGEIDDIASTRALVFACVNQYNKKFKKKIKVRTKSEEKGLRIHRIK